MAIQQSSEFKGIGFNYDSAAQPFFKAIVKENLRLLEQLATGKALLSAIRKTTPAYRPKNYPNGVNVVIQPPLARTWTTPGFGSMIGKVIDQTKFDDFNTARASKDTSFSARKAGRLIPGISAKTQVQEDNKKAASDGTGSTCTLFYSNNEMLSDSGTWFVPHITMGHELIHCYHALLGVTDPDNRKEEYKTVGMKGYTGTYTENMLRNDANYPQRTKYFSDD